MSSALKIYGALANAGIHSRDYAEMRSEMFREWLTRTEDLHLFVAAPPPPGIQSKGAFDWQGVLGTGADLLAFGGLLWAAYERFVKPRLKNDAQSTKSFLYIVIEHPDGHRIEFQLGTAYYDHSVFIEQFVRTVSELRATGAQYDTETLVSGGLESESLLRITIRSNSTNEDK